MTAWIEHVEERVAGGFVDRLGRVVCIGCGGAEREGARFLAASNLDGGPCSVCGRALAECEPRVRRRAVIVEAFPFKIF